MAYQLLQRMKLQATDRKVAMSSTSPETEPTATHLGGAEDGAEKYLHDVSGEGLEAESPQAKQAKAEALAHARAARAARARYARLTSQQPGVYNRNPNNMMPAESYGEVMTAQDDRIGGVEASLVTNILFDEVRALLPKATTPLGNVPSALLSYLPFLWLRPARRGSGFGAVVTDPRVWSIPAILAVTVGGEAVKGKVVEMLRDLDAARKSHAERDEQLKSQVSEVVIDIVDARLAERLPNTTSTPS